MERERGGKCKKLVSQPVSLAVFQILHKHSCSESLFLSLGAVCNRAAFSQEKPGIEFKSLPFRRVDEIRENFGELF